MKKIKILLASGVATPSKKNVFSLKDQKETNSSFKTNKGDNSNIPQVFLKKINNSNKKIPLNTLGDFQGIGKSFAPQSTEWNNSVYSYNGNYNKLLTVADKKILKLAISYINSKFRRKQKENKISRAKDLGLTLPLYRRKKKRRISLRKRLSLNKVFLANGGVKHTSTSAIITLFFYKSTKNYIRHNTILKLFRMNFKKTRRELKLYPTKKKPLPKLALLAIRKLQSFYGAQTGKDKKNNRLPVKLFKFKKRLENLTDKGFKYYYRKMHRRAHFIKERFLLSWELLFKQELLDISQAMILYFSYITYKPDIHKPIKTDKVSPFMISFENKRHFYKNKGGELAIARWRSKIYRMSVLKYNDYLRFFLLNQLKFKKRFLHNFQTISSKIYNKNVIFNFVRLKKYYYNSNIFSQMLAIKLKKRQLGLSNILRMSFAKIKLAKLPRKLTREVIQQNILISRTKLKQNIFTQQNIIDLLCLTPAPKIINQTNYFWFELLLFKYHRIINPFTLFGRITLNHRKMQDLQRGFVSRNKTSTKTLKNNITAGFAKKQIKKLIRRFYLKTKFIKNQILAGVRVEITGRLTRRFKAARPLYQLKWLGGKRNIDATYLGLPVALSRGHALSNAESTVLSSFRRIGAYGIKTTVSSADTKYYSSR